MRRSVVWFGFDRGSGGGDSTVKRLFNAFCRTLAPFV